VLNLPGIGSFYLDDVVDVQSIADKNSRDLLEHIHFAQKNISRPDDELIDFIRKHTGKIRPLAESDLETFVADGKLMLNIGKPFHIEGIGTLQKNKDAVYEFAPGLPAVQRLESPPPIIPPDREQPQADSKKKSVFDENPYETRNASTRRMAMILGVVIGLGIILWGGYSLFSSKVGHSNVAANSTAANPEDSVTHTSQYLHNLDTPQKALAEVIKKDSTHFNKNDQAETTKTAAPAATPAATAPTTAAVATGPSKMYKYVLQTTQYKTTALGMYNRLKPKVVLETTPDSSFFKIVISLPGTPADTTRIKDSLHFWYWGTRPRPVTIEQ
jgi:hypothetical protein